MKRRVSRIGLGWYTNKLVLRPTLGAAEIVVRLSLVHRGLGRSERFQEDIQRGRRSLKVSFGNTNVIRRSGFRHGSHRQDDPQENYLIKHANAGAPTGAAITKV